MFGRANIKHLLLIPADLWLSKPVLESEKCNDSSPGADDNDGTSLSRDQCSESRMVLICVLPCFYIPCSKENLC